MIIKASMLTELEELKSCQCGPAGIPREAGELDKEGSRVKQKLWNQQNDIKDDSGGHIERRRDS